MFPIHRAAAVVLMLAVLCISTTAADDSTVRVFIFAGQSNMVGSDSHVEDIQHFPPFQGLQQAQPKVRFAYSIGRDKPFTSDGWVDLQPVNSVVGPELSFARKVSQHTTAPIAIIKCAAGGTHLGGDWNPDDPQGFKMYPRTLELIRRSLAELEQQGIQYRIEGFMWHQGENDMFNEDYMAQYGKNLANFLASWRRDLKSPELKFYIGELCTKTIWGMDLRPRMDAISRGQRVVTEADPLAEYVSTSHVGVEIGGGVGLHYHYGTLGQLEHGVNYADAYLRTIGRDVTQPRPLATWPYAANSKVKLFVLAGHRNMEGERAFVQELQQVRPRLGDDNPNIAFKYSLGGGYKVSDGWEPLGPTGPYDTFGPELSFADALQTKIADNIAIAKFTHSGSQMNDWTPEGSMATARHIYPQFIAFIKQSIAELQQRGHEVELVGVFYHVGENEMSMPPYRKQTPAWLAATIQQSRQDLKRSALDWYVSQQAPTDHESVNAFDVMGAIKKLAGEDEHVVHIPVIDLPPQRKQLVLDTAGVVQLGDVLAEKYVR